MPQLLDEIYRIQEQLTELDAREKLLLKMFANILESHYKVRKPRNRMVIEEYREVPGRWELMDGMLRDY